jgi:hypothetical protein
MPGPAHETLVALIQQRPEMLDLLLRTLGYPGLPPGVKVRDSAVRVANPLEVRPDIVLTEDDDRGAWVLNEIQLTIDPAKQRRWIAAAGVLFDTHGVMGDVVIITHEAHVAEWASVVARVVGPSGTRLTLEPVVLLLSRAEVERLLAAEKPELAVFAAWAVHDQRGREAQEVVRAAAERIEATTDAELRETLTRAMISMLGDPLVAVLKEMWMKPIVFPESPAARELRELLEARGELRGELRGEARALLTVLAARGLNVDEDTRARIRACVDALTLDRWVTRAVTAATLDDVFATDGGT